MPCQKKKKLFNKPLDLKRENLCISDMTPEQIAEKLVSRAKGQLYTVKSRRPCKLKKGFNLEIFKETEQQGMLCDYSRREPVREGVESGEREAPELPKGVKAVKHIGGVKFYEMANGNICLSVPLSGNKAKSKYLLNGQEVSQERISDYLLASEKVEPESKEELEKLHQVPFKMISVGNIIEIH
jgi:hypothetical protein